MAQVDRFSVSLDTELLAAFDRHIAQKGYENRSEAVRDLIRDLPIADRVPTGTERIAGLVTVVVDHRETEVSARLRSHLASHAEVVQSVMQTGVDADRDRLAIALRGQAERVQKIANEI
ncbi:MAG: ribbon-helix-helix protein, CopG family, partial [Planctomycetes bacterium]|nr:ribbon-helix-helix protein, CopG family [Planctomycetota bacterium]